MIRFKEFLFEFSGPKIQKTLNRLSKSNLLNGELIGGAAYSVLMGFASTDIGDIDIFGFAPDIEDVEKLKWAEILSADPHKGTVEELKDKMTNIKVSFISQETSFKLGASPQEILRTRKTPIRVKGFRVAAPEDVVDMMLSRNKGKDQKRIANLIQKYDLGLNSKKWVNRREFVLLYTDLIKRRGSISDSDLNFTRKVLKSREGK